MPSWLLMRHCLPRRKTKGYIYNEIVQGKEKNLLFTYPVDLLCITTERWNGIQQRLSDIKEQSGENTLPPSSLAPLPAPFPSEEELRTILDTVYHVSFLTEESRQITARIAFIIPSVPVLNLPKNVNPFRSPIPFTVSEVLRLAPALDYRYSMMAICPANEVPDSQSDSLLVIWGVISQGSEWWDAISRRRAGAAAPPNCLTVSIFAPGNISASTIGRVLFRLRTGELVIPTLEELSEGPIGDFLKTGAESLHRETAERLEVKKDNEKLDSYPYQLYFQTFANIAKLACEHRHGGAFVVLPDEIDPNDDRLQERMRIKYPLTSPDIWEELLRAAAAYWYSSYFLKKSMTTSLSVEELKEQVSWRDTSENALRHIADFEQFVSSLSGVDGAVVLTKRLKIIGFGAEIIADSPDLVTVKIAKDSSAKSSVDRRADAFGTRHRSAMRLCSSLEESLCFVISQDGSIRAIKRVGSDVYMWNDVSLTSTGL